MCPFYDVNVSPNCDNCPAYDVCLSRSPISEEILKLCKSIIECYAKLRDEEENKNE